MNKRLALYILVILALFGTVLAVPALAQSQTVTIRTFDEQNFSVGLATIYVDGSFYGNTNTVGILQSDDFTPGNHTITATKTGYVNATYTGSLAPGTITRLVLVHDFEAIPPDAVTIIVEQNTVARTTVSGAYVIVDGSQLGSTTDTVQGKTWGVVTPGNHTVTVAKTDDVTLKNTTVTLDLQPGNTYVILMQLSGVKYSIFDWGLFVISLQKILTFGLENTILLSVIAFALGIIIGLIMGIGRTSAFMPFRVASSIYVEGVRGLPLVLQLLFMNFGLPYLISQLLNTTFDINIFTACIIALSMNSGAYMGEIFKAGIEAVHKGQTEAARSLGMSHNQALRFIILPQAFKIVLPALGNEFIALIKDSSIALVISYPEIVYWAKVSGAQYYNTFTPYLAAGLVYLVITIPLGKAVQYMEKRLNTKVVKPREKGAGWLGMGQRAEAKSEVKK